MKHKKLIVNKILNLDKNDYSFQVIDSKGIKIADNIINEETANLIASMYRLKSASEKALKLIERMHRSGEWFLVKQELRKLLNSENRR